mmetsp:Transcript_34089/g.71757  ORF Transcript_34089/g.71757 Transcript_34089/m.71757 type:complete len:108 (+) Transcript_34089:110-433(+)
MRSIRSKRSPAQLSDKASTAVSPTKMISHLCQAENTITKYKGNFSLSLGTSGTFGCRRMPLKCFGCGGSLHGLRMASQTALIATIRVANCKLRRNSPNSRNASSVTL